MTMARVDSRLVRRLAVAGRRLVVEGNKVRLLVEGRSDGEAASIETFRRLRGSGALHQGKDGSWELSDAGRNLARRLATSPVDMARQHQLRGQRRIGEGVEQRFVTVDLGESPLGWLRARKDRDGRPLIGDAEFEAGERIRADFTRGQLMPGITTNWDPGASAGRRSGAPGGAGELTDAALSARLRVERAMAALGPELSGAVVDFCCFLKGIETIERERNWPKRSARLVLQLGLSALARHYGFANEAVGSVHCRRRDGEARPDVA